LEAGKSVFVEKPLCLTAEELNQISGAYRKASEAGSKRPILMIGYNRRFAPLTIALRSRLGGRKQPLAMTFTCNAGAIPADHWTQDPKVGGGRIIGEACHFIDLLHFIADESPITHVAAMKHGPNDAGNLGDTVSISLHFADGSLGQINYFANGARQYPKEQLDVFAEGHVLRIDNFRRLKLYGCRGKNRRSWTQDKGHDQGFRAFVEAVRTGGQSPINFESILNTTRATFAALEAIENQTVVALAHRQRFAVQATLSKGFGGRNVQRRTA
ncbi:MAG: Gfo/Idh/MocA family oxidoreductase, partial [Planctomycetota bacterium]